MKVRIRISCTLEELKEAIANRQVNSVFGNNKVNLAEIHKSITGEEINYAFLGEVYKESDAKYKSIGEHLYPIGLFTVFYQLLMVVIEMDIHEEEDIIFPRSAFPTDIGETDPIQLLTNINENRIFDLSKENNKCNTIILTRISELNIIGAVAV